MFNKKKFDIEDVIIGFSEHKKHLLNLCEIVTNRFNTLEDNIFHLSQRLSQKVSDAKTINMLTQALCDKYSKGIFIMYDEHNPREVVIIKDGGIIDMSNATSVSFCWDKDEFPRMSIDRV